MMYDIPCVKAGNNGDDNNACDRKLSFHAGDCTLDGCVYTVLVAVSNMLRRTGLGWNAAELVRDIGDDHETPPIMSSATGGASSMSSYDQATNQDADSSSCCCDDCCRGDCCSQSLCYLSGDCGGCDGSGCDGSVCDCSQCN